MSQEVRSRDKKRVLILAPFFDAGGCAWIDDFCGRDDFEFKKVPYPYHSASWHERGATTPLTEWLSQFRFALEATKWTSDCIVTCFPQLAFAVAASLQLTDRSNRPLIAWTFNLGSLSGEWKGYLAGKVLGRVDRFVVHATSEIGNYAKWLNIAEDKFRFVPFQKGRIEKPKPSPIPAPYIVSMGSANRDYHTLVEAILGSGIKTVIISKKSIIESLPEHQDLVKLTNLSMDECNCILAGARLNVVPIASAQQTASGQVTLITSLRMGVPTIATRCVGTVDYLVDGETGLLVPPGDVTALRYAIECLWRDDTLRMRIGSAGSEHAEKYFSDEAAGRYFAQVLDEVLAGINL